jgi:uncharacterized protein (TIGR00375 family)
MCLEEMARFARIKGLTVIGTGDFTHPTWFEELKKKLVFDPETNLYKLASDPTSSVHFMVTTEVCTVFYHENQAKKIHHVIFTANLETAAQINHKLGKYGSLQSDGRPTLNMTAAALVEEVVEISNENLIFPAHVWTPWFSLFGAFSGFDAVEECYQDMTKHIYALETGLSSDPPMNWRLSKLDKYTLLSNSDCHSFWPWRIGREANVFELEKPSYKEVTESIRLKDKKRFRFTIETDPAYGKYHWTGHRNCNVALSAREARKLANICPVCRRKLTKGVEQRVDELADRAEGFVPDNFIDFVRLQPLSEIISLILGTDSPAAQKVWNVYNALIEKLGNEYNVLINASREQLVPVAGEVIADTIIKVRDGKADVVPGYDGVYGRLVVSNGRSNLKSRPRSVQQSNLTDFT